MSFAMYQWSLSSYRYPDDAAPVKHKLRSSFLPANNQFEREGFNNWGIKTMEDIVNNPKFFSDEFVLMRASLLLKQTLCNHSLWHTQVLGSSDSAVYDVSEVSIVKSYQEKFKPVVF